MTSNKLMAGVIATTAMALAVGCAGTPLSTTQAPATAPETNRSVLAAGDMKAGFEQMRANLPARISVADAKRMLTTIDPSKISAKDNPASVQWLGLRGFRSGWFGGYGGLGLGLGYGLGAGWGGMYGYPGLGYPGFMYYNYGNFCYPYYLDGGFYYPYTYGGYSPFLYQYSSVWYPYTFSNGLYW